MMFTMEPNNARNTQDAEIAERIERLHTFKRWITHDVIPSLRKHGVYAVDKMLDDPDAMIAALTAGRACADWLSACERLGVPAGPVNDLSQVFASPQVAARGMAVDLDGASGRIAVLHHLGSATGAVTIFTATRGSL